MKGVQIFYIKINGNFNDIAIEKNVQDTFQNGRGTALTDFLYRGELDIITSNWEGYHRIFVKQKESFLDMSSLDFRSPSRIRTVISADFDNDGYDEIFLNNIGQPNKLFVFLVKETRRNQIRCST